MTMRQIPQLATAHHKPDFGRIPGRGLAGNPLIFRLAAAITFSMANQGEAARLNCLLVSPWPADLIFEQHR
jgi:hypothetical protein